MTALFAYHRLPLVLTYVSLALLVAAAMTHTRAPPIRSPSSSTRRRSTKMPDNVSTPVIGNPLIADLSVQPGGLLVVTGKGFGTINLIALDRSGAVRAERNIQGRGAQEPRLRLSRPQPRDLQLYAGLRAAHHALRLARLLRQDARADQQPQCAGQPAASGAAR